MSRVEESTRCHYTTAAGRCRMPRTDVHSLFCGTHLRSQERNLRSDPAARPIDILGGLTDLGSATAVNHVLNNIATFLTDDRINARKALVLAYICQLLLQSIALDRREREERRSAHSPSPVPASS